MATDVRHHLTGFSKRSKKSVGMHWGTFILTDEPLTEPPERLAEEAKKAGLAKDEFVVIDIGETLVV